MKGKEVDGDITKFEYDPYKVLKTIIEPAGDMLEFNFDLLGRMRRYWTSTRDSGFNYEGSKRLGDYDDKDEEWKRYHWCKTQLLGYADDTNTYYTVPDVTGSTKLILNSNSVVNRLDYDHLGYLRNKTTDPQVELLWKGLFCNSDDSENYLLKKPQLYYIPILGCYFSLRNMKLDINNSYDSRIGSKSSSSLFYLGGIWTPSFTGSPFIGGRMFMSGCGGGDDDDLFTGPTECNWVNTYQQGYQKYCCRWEGGGVYCIWIKSAGYREGGHVETMTEEKMAKLLEEIRGGQFSF